MLLFGPLSEEVAHALQRHVITVEIEAQREVGIGGWQIQVGQVVNRGLYLGRIILMNLGAQGCSAMKN